MNESARGLIEYIDACPTPWHAVSHTADILTAEGYEEVNETEAWRLEPGGKYYLRRAGTLVAFNVGTKSPVEQGFRIIGAHTDSPNLRVKPNPELTKSGMQCLGVETYGGVLFHTWLDRDLSIAGRVFATSHGERRQRMIKLDAPQLRIPSLAIHLDRNVNREGLKVNAQKHLQPLVSLHDEFSFENLLRQQLDLDELDVTGFDICLFDTQKSTLAGPDEVFINAPRLDNLASCHASLRALLHGGDTESTRVIALYDHEECGSRSAHGAQSNFLHNTLSRIVHHFDASSDALMRSIASSFLLSADMAHAHHPNYADRHDPEHRPILGKGPVLKINQNQSYATDGEGMALFHHWCNQAGVANQHFVTRSDLPCGSTIGPITAAKLGIRSLDIGAPMLSMHSCREMMATADVEPTIRLMQTFFHDETRPHF